MSQHSHSKLRDYQLEAVNSILKELIAGNNALLCLPTGSGKSVIISYIVGLSKKRVLILVNKISLLHQMIGHVIDAGKFYSKEKQEKRVMVATVQSIKRIKNDFDLIIFDEAHTLTDSIQEWIGNTLLLGVTATTFTAKDFIYGKDKIFKKVCFERGFDWAVNSGFLVKPILKRMPESFDVEKLNIKLGDYVIKELEEMALDHEKMFAQVKDAIPRLVDRKKIVWACVSINHAEALNKVIKEFGEKSIVCHSKQDDFDIDEFKTGNARHLVFVTMISTGFDYPPIDAVVLMRPTRSTVMMIQTIGRGLRLFGDKKDCTILDYGCVIEHCGTPSKPILNMSGAKKKTSEIKMKFCPACLNYLDSKEKKCECGHEFKTDKRDVLKNLTTTANGEKLIKFKAVFYKQYKFKTKKGNIVNRIDYSTSCYLKISEFFKIRFKEGEGTCNLDLECIKDGKYFKIIRVGNSESNS